MGKPALSSTERWLLLGTAPALTLVTLACASGHILPLLEAPWDRRWNL